MAATAPTSSSSATSDNIAVMKLPSQELEQGKDFQRIYAVTVKLPKQLRIQDRRICQQFRKVVNHQKVDIDVLVLDLETYYTVAHDLLKLMLRHLPKSRKPELESDATFKTICTIRDHLVRHAYDKARGDPYNCLVWNRERGPCLRLGSPTPKFRDSGYFVNRENLMSLLEKYSTEPSLMFPAVARVARLVQSARHRHT